MYRGDAKREDGFELSSGAFAMSNERERVTGWPLPNFDTKACHADRHMERRPGDSNFPSITARFVSTEIISQTLSRLVNSLL